MGAIEEHLPLKEWGRKAGSAQRRSDLEHKGARKCCWKSMRLWYYLDCYSDRT